MNAKTAKDSLVVMNELVLPNDTNHLDSLMGGRLMYWMDIAAALSSMKHSNNICVTAGVDNLIFRSAIDKGTNANIEAKVTRVFNTSMEVKVVVYSENYITLEKKLCNEAYFTMVAIDKENKIPISVCDIIPETKEEFELYDSAHLRRQIRLFLAKKISLSKEELISYLR